MKNNVLICKTCKLKDGYMFYKPCKKGVGICDICLGCMECNERDEKYGFNGIWDQYHNECDMSFISDIF